MLLLLEPSLFGPLLVDATIGAADRVAARTVASVFAGFESIFLWAFS